MNCTHVSFFCEISGGCIPTLRVILVRANFFAVPGLESLHAQKCISATANNGAKGDSQEMANAEDK